MCFRILRWSYLETNTTYAKVKVTIRKGYEKVDNKLIGNEKAENEYEKFIIKQVQEYISSTDEMYQKYLEKNKK